MFKTLHQKNNLDYQISIKDIYKKYDIIFIQY
jgi:hypothetical protein